MNQFILKLHKIIKENTKSFDPSGKTCIFCGEEKGITREHLFPKWSFENDVKKSFYISPEDNLYSYHLSCLPCCKNCNSNILGNFEQHIKNLFLKKEKNYSDEERENIIFWIKYLDFKFKIFGIEKACHKNKKSKSTTGLNLKLDSNIDKLLEELFQEIDNTDSLIIREASQNNFDFFYWRDHYFSLNLPQCNVSIFYFFTNKIENIGAFCSEVI